MNVNEMGRYIHFAWNSAKIVFLLSTLAACAPVSSVRSQESTQVPTPIVTPSQSDETISPYPDNLIFKACTEGEQGGGCAKDSDPIPNLIVGFFLVNDEGESSNTIYGTTDADGQFIYDANYSIYDFFLTTAVDAQGNAPRSECSYYDIFYDDGKLEVEYYPDILCTLQANNLTDFSN